MISNLMIHALLFAYITGISCVDAQKMTNRVWSIENMTVTQKMDIVITLQESMPHCNLLEGDSKKND